MTAAPSAARRLAAPVLEADVVSRHFGPVRALDEVSFGARAGEVVALMGENGAGKSTLLRLFSGDDRPTAGTLRLDGEPLALPSARAAHEHGIRIVFQEPEVIPHVSVAENVLVGALPAHRRVIRRAAIERRAAELIERCGFSDVIDARLRGEDLSPAQRQLVEILRALAAPVRVLALDEPTSSLGDKEVAALFALIRRLCAENTAVVFVSHRMDEVFAIADRVAVLRDGRSVGERPVPDVTRPELVRMMVGRDLGDLFVRRPTPVGDVVLSVKGLTTADVRDVDLKVRAGEVVALAGLIGAGRSELALALMGDAPIESGEVALSGRALRLRNPAQAIKAGIGLAPEERKAQGLLLGRTVRDNVSLAVLRRLTRFRVVRRAEERRLAETYTTQLNVRASSIEQPVSALSGGNQQKVVLARWLARRPQLLILDEPTRGIDVGAKAEIYAIIGDLAADGVAVLMISSELPEVIGLADRVVVLAGGRVSGELPRARATEEAILALALPDRAHDLEGSPA